MVFRYPRDPQEYFIKRVVGIPGEEIQIKDGKVYIYNEEDPDGFELKESYLKEEIITNAISGEKVKIKENEYYFLGDNRPYSKDSRIFGPVNRSFIVGKVWKNFGRYK